MKIRKAAKDDAAVTAGMVRALLDELCGEPVQWDTDAKQELCRDMVAAGDYIVFHAVNGDGDVVGMMTLAETESLYAGGKIGLVQELYVVPSMRCQALGKTLIEKAIDYARERQWYRLEVGAPAYPQWARTKEFYLREGFTEIGPRLKYKL